MERSVSFFSDGHRIAATLFTPSGEAGFAPDDGAPHPGIVMCQGAIGQRQFFGFPDIARRFTALGYAVLTFDHRGFGESEGEHGRIFQIEQVQDIRDAMSYLAARPEADGERLALFGTSIGGGSVVYAGAVDERARWVISIVGFHDGEHVALGRVPEGGRAAVLDRIAGDRAERVTSGRSALIRRADISTPNPASTAVRTRVIGGDPGADTTVPDLTLESLERLIEFKPIEMASRIAPRAALFMAAEDDELTPAEGVEAMFQRAGEPKAYERLPGITHYEIYEEPHVSKLISLTDKWIRAH